MMQEPRVTDRDAGSVVIVGAGIIGLAIGLRLQLAGRNVTLIDRDAPGRGCSFGNAGRIANESIEPLASMATLRAVPRYLITADGPLGFRLRHALRVAPWLLGFARASLPANFARGKAALQSLQQHSLPAFTRLLDDAGALSLLKANGHLLVTENSDAISTLARLREQLAVDGILARPVSRNDVQQLAPGLSPHVAGGLLFPDTAHVVEPYQVCTRLAAAIEQRGGRICRGDVTEVAAMSAGGFRLRYGERECGADAVVIAAGAWSRPLARQLGHRLPLDTGLPPDSRRLSIRFANAGREPRAPHGHDPDACGAPYDRICRVRRTPAAAGPRTIRSVATPPARNCARHRARRVHEMDGSPAVTAGPLAGHRHMRELRPRDPGLRSPAPRPDLVGHHGGNRRGTP